VTKLVSNYYERHQASVRLAATGDLLEHLRDDLNGSEREHLAALIRQLPGPDSQHVQDEIEARTARRALVAYWLNAVDDAMRALSSEGRVKLSMTLLPPKPSAGTLEEAVWNKWEDRRFRSEESVLANIALDPPDLVSLTKVFARNMAAAVRARGGMPIPPDDILVLAENGFELRSRNRQRAPLR
jgi:hypothetical protein